MQLDIKKEVEEYQNSKGKINPLVSISVVTYQHVNYIKQCIDGILMQKTNFKFEILLGEDASTDGTRELCIEYAKKYPSKIRLFLHDRKNVIYINGNATGRFNMLYNLQQAKGKYIALCEGDDYWTDPLKLQKQVDFLEANEDFAICFHNSYVIFDDVTKPTTVYSDFPWNNIVKEKSIYKMEDVIEAPLMPTASIVFRNTVDFSIPDSFHGVASGDMVLAMLLCGENKIKYFDVCWSTYRKHEKGITSNHKGDWIHANRIFMYMRMMEYYSFNYKTNFKKVILKHLMEMNSYNLISCRDRIKIFFLFPYIFFKILKRIKI